MATRRKGGPTGNGAGPDGGTLSYSPARSADVGFTPPSSPPTRPRNDRNVFSRLTSNQSQGSALDK